MINTDSFLQIGSSHSVCEDYILTGDSKLKYVILADGCSSSPKTEMGARILCYLARQYLKYYRFNDSSSDFGLNYDTMGSWIIHNAEMIARQLGLSKTSLDSTLMISFLDPHDPSTVNIFIYGDGFVVLVPKHGSLRIWEIEFKPENMPFYLSYLIDPVRKSVYHSKKVSKFFTESYIPNNPSSVVEFAYDHKIEFQISMEDYKALLLFSDGLKSFVKKDEAKLLDPLEVIEGLVSFKTIKGKYLQRRVSKELLSLEKKRIRHFDDIAIGAYINEDLWDGNIQLDRSNGSTEI